MKIVRTNSFFVKIEGKCLTPNDIIELWKFGYSLNGICKKYAKDNKIQISKARSIVGDSLYRYTLDNSKKRVGVNK